MPLLSCSVNQPMDPHQQKKVLKKLSAIAAQETGKPEQYVMVAIEQSALLMGGNDAPAAYVDARGIGGFDPGMNRRLSEKICQALQEILQIPPNRVYLTFTAYQAADWGWDGSTFG